MPRPPISASQGLAMSRVGEGMKGAQLTQIHSVPCAPLPPVFPFRHGSFIQHLYSGVASMGEGADVKGIASNGSLPLGCTLSGLHCSALPFSQVNSRQFGRL